MNSLISFNYNNNVVRTQVTEDGEPLFCLVDVCNILGITDPSNVTRQLKEEFETSVLNTGVIQRETGPVEATFVTEPQLYFVLYRSRSNKAKPFRRWVDSEVLPSIRKTGEYKLNQENRASEEEAFAEYKTVDVEKVGDALKNLLKTTVPSGAKRLELANDFMNKCLKLDLLDIAQYKPIAEPTVIDDVPRYTPTELGKPYGLSPQKINKLLEQAGLQYKEGTGWIPTEEGKLQGGVLLSLDGHLAASTNISQLKWPITVINLIMTESGN